VPYYQTILDIDEEPLPLFNLFGRQIFFFAPFGMPYWSILSVLLTIAGVILSLVTILRAVNQKKKENKNVDNQYSAMLRSENSFNDDTFIDLLKHKELYNKKRRLALLVLMYIFSIGAVLLLLIIQNFRGVIALFDWWVIPHAVLFVFVVICSKLVFRKENSVLHTMLEG
jgi:purine-cytosine permease-like protein